MHSVITSRVEYYHGPVVARVNAHSFVFSETIDTAAVPHQQPDNLGIQRKRSTCVTPDGASS